MKALSSQKLIIFSLLGLLCLSAPHRRVCVAVGAVASTAGDQNKKKTDRKDTRDIKGNLRRETEITM